jgi:hypothetical protein
MDFSDRKQTVSSGEKTRCVLCHRYEMTKRIAQNSYQEVVSMCGGGAPTFGRLIADAYLEQ